MRRLVVQIPDFEYLPGGAEVLPAGVRRLLARAEYQAGRTEVLLAGSLGVEALPSSAALSRLGADGLDDGDQERCWLRFDAVSMVPDLTAVWLENPLPLDFGSAGMQAVTDELKAMFEAQGLDWRPRAGCRFGLLGLNEPPRVEFRPLDEVPGQRLDHVLPEGPDSARWRALINESQMVFHQFRALNRADQRGAGLWFWGAGVIPPRPHAGPLRVIESGADAVLSGVAAWMEADLVPADSFSDLTPADDTVLVRGPLSGSADPLASLGRLFSQWLEPAMGQTNVDIIGARGMWRLRPRDRWRIWRRNAPSGFDRGDG